MKWLLTIIVALALAGLGWWWYDNYATPTDTSQQAAAGENVDETNENGDVNLSINVEGGTPPPSEATVMLTNEGFSPRSVTIQKGGTVTFVNESSGEMWVASAMHPTHVVYDGTTLEEHCDDAANVPFDQCAGGSTYSFTFDKAGTWNYHNHLVNGQFGSVVVVE